MGLHSANATRPEEDANTADDIAGFRGKASLISQGMNESSIAFAYCPLGRRVASASEGGLRLQVFERGNLLWERRLDLDWHSQQAAGGARTSQSLAGKLSCVSYSTCGTRVAVGHECGVVCVYNAEDGSEMARLREDRDWVLDLAFLPGKNHVVVGSSGGRVEIRDTSTGELVTYLRETGCPVCCVSASSNGDRIAAGLHDGSICIWEGLDPQNLPVLRDHEHPIKNAGFSPSGDLFCTCSVDGTVRAWESANGRENARLKRCAAPVLVVVDEYMMEHSSEIGHFCVSPAEDKIAGGCRDGSIFVWELPAKGGSLFLDGHMKAVNAICFSPTKNHLASGSDDKTVRIWDGDKDWSPLVLSGAGAVYAVAYSPTGDRLAAGLQGGLVQLWNLDCIGDPLRLRGHDSVVRCVAFSNSGNLLASGSADSTVRIWEAVTGEEIAVLLGHDDTVRGISFCQASDRIVSSSRDGTVRVWELASGKCVEVIHGASDAAAIAREQTSACGCRALRRDHDTMFVPVNKKAPVAFFHPVDLQQHERRYLWGGTHWQHAYVIVLEGASSHCILNDGSLSSLPTPNSAPSAPSLSQHQYILASQELHTGTELSETGDLVGALNAYCSALNILLGLATSDPDNTTWQSEIAVCHEKIGEALIGQGKLYDIAVAPDALDAYRSALQIRRCLAEAEPANARRQLDLALLYYKMATIQRNHMSITDDLCRCYAVLDGMKQRGMHLNAQGRQLHQQLANRFESPQRGVQ